MNSATSEIIALIRNCELREARRRLRKYIATNETARKAVRRLNNLIAGQIDDVQRSTSAIITMLWHTDITIPSNMAPKGAYRGWSVFSNGVRCGFMLRYGTSWRPKDCRYICIRRTREEAIRYMLDHKHENPHYSEAPTIAWLSDNGYPHLIELARINSKAS